MSLKPKISTRKETRWVEKKKEKEIQNKQMVENINTVKSWFFGSFNKFNSP